MPAEPPGALRPAWVGVARRLLPRADTYALRPGDPVHARMLRRFCARALHEPLRAVLSGEAAQAVERLLPGNPKPVAALTRAPEVVEPLLLTLEAKVAEDDDDDEEVETRRRDALERLSAQVLFSLACAGALQVESEVQGPRLLEHCASRRGLSLAQGQTLRLGPDGLVLDGQRLDPWGSELGGRLSKIASFAVLASQREALSNLEGALELIRREDPFREDLHIVFDAVCCAPQSPARATAPRALGRATLPSQEELQALGPDADAQRFELARALLRESGAQKLTTLRLCDALVEDEVLLSALYARTDTWALARLGRPALDATEGTPNAPTGLTELGRMVWEELGTLAPSAPPR